MSEFTVNELLKIIKNQKAQAGFDRLELAGKDFSGLEMIDVIFDRANLSGSDFSKTVLTNCSFIDCTLAGASFENAKTIGCSFERARLSAIDFNDCSLIDANLKDADASGGDFSNANLSGANLENTTLIGSNFTNAQMPDDKIKSSEDKKSRGKASLQSDRRPLKIFLCMPTWTEDLGGFSKVGKTRNPQVPLGLLYLATLAEQKGHVVEFCDCDVEEVGIPEIIQRVQRENYDLIGLSATSPIFHKAVMTAKAIKEKSPEAKIMIGGEHINILKKEAMADCFDFAAFGECEETWPEFLDAYMANTGDYSDIDGLIWRKDGEVIQNKPRRLFPDLDELPLPAIHLTKLDAYKMTFAKWKYRNTGKYVSIMMTRGCPFKCTFCSESSAVKYGGEALPVRFRSPENIVAEIEYHYKTHDVRHFFFMDSNISLRKSHVKKMCNLLIEKNLPITFEGWTRANLVNDEIMSLLSRAGMIRMSVGVESGDPEILRIIKKEVSHDAIRNAFYLMSKYEIEPQCSAMLGNPGETSQTIRNSIKFLDSIPELLYTTFSISNPYPGTEMLMWAKEGKYGLRLRYDDLSKYTRYDDSPIEVNDLSAEDLVRYQSLGLLKVHLKPRRFIAAIRMIGFWNLVPVAINMVTKGIKDLPSLIKVFFTEKKSDVGYAPQS